MKLVEDLNRMLKEKYVEVQSDLFMESGANASGLESELQDKLKKMQQMIKDSPRKMMEKILTINDCDTDLLQCLILTDNVEQFVETHRTELALLLAQLVLLKYGKPKKPKEVSQWDEALDSKIGANMITKQNVIDLFLTFETQSANHFEAQLYRLIAKADTNNRARLLLGFLNQVQTYLAWYETPSPKEFYDVYLTEQEQRDLKNGKVVVP